jgi:hypothetical protein
MHNSQTAQAYWPPHDGPITILIDGSGLGIVLLILFLIATIGMILREGGDQ